MVDVSASIVNFLCKNLIISRTRLGFQLGVVKRAASTQASSLLKMDVGGGAISVEPYACVIPPFITAIGLLAL